MRAPYQFTVGENSTGQCTSCGEVFFGEGAFDGHLRGEGEGRHCIDPADPPLRKSGEPEQWWLDDRGRWHIGRRMPEDVRMALEASRSRAGADKTPSPVSQVPPADSEPSDPARARRGEA